MKNIFHLLFFSSVLFIPDGWAQELLVRGNVVDVVTKKQIQATLYFEKQPDASVTVITESGNEGYHARIFYRALYQVKVSSPGYISERTEIDFLVDSIKEQKECYFSFSLIPIQLNGILPFNELLFDPGSFKISPFAVPDLLRLKDVLLANPSIEIQLEGYTDSKGKSRKAMILAKKRIKSVKDFLVARGLSSKRIRLKAMGGVRPSTTIEEEDVHKANRRVEVRVVKM